MSFSEAAWHLVDFFAPALGVGLLAASLVKLFWRGALLAVPWRRLAAFATLACGAALTGGLLAFGRDGRMATYAVMTLACAVGLWLAAFRRRRG